MAATKVLITSIIGIVGYLVGAASMFLMEELNITLGLFAIIFVGFAMIAVFGSYFLNLFFIALDAKKRGLSQALFLLGFFLGPLGGVIYYFISKNQS